MKTAKFELKEKLQSQLDSYNKYPISSEFDRGYKAGINYALDVLYRLYPQLRGTEYEHC